MIEAVATEHIRHAERPLLDAGVPLMAHVAFAVAQRVRQQLTVRAGAVAGRRVVVLVGPGSNGGDGLFAAAHLARAGVRTLAVTTTPRIHADGLEAARRAGVVLVSSASSGRAGLGALTPGAAAREALAADVVVDAMLGIGARGALRGAGAAIVRAVNRQRPRRGGPFVVAVDVPSGIGVDDGTVPGPVLRADLTLACGSPAPGLLLPPAAHLAQDVEVIDTGLDLSGATSKVLRLEDTDVPTLWPRALPEHDKYRRGVVGVVAGTRAYPGAGVLSTGAAVRSGAGMVRYLGPGDVTRAVLAAHPEVVHGTGRVQSWVVGPGLDAEDTDQLRQVDVALAEAGLGPGAYFSGAGVWGDGGSDGIVPVVVDAGALTRLPERCAPWIVLTPHAGELARLLTERGVAVDREQVESAPAEHAATAQRLTGATVLLKGATTVVVGPGQVLSQAEAPAWLATAGAGDVLAGLLGTLLAGRSREAVQSPDLVARLAALAALVHGRAATLANPGGPVSASMVVEALPRTIARLLAG